MPRLLARARRRLGARALGLLGYEPLHFLHVRKSGGSAIRDALGSRRRFGSYVVILPGVGHGKGLRQVPVGDQCFFFVRNPVSRFASGFWDCYRQSGPKYHIPWRAGETAAFARFHTPNELASATS